MKNIKLSLKLLEGEEGSEGKIQGYGAVFGNKDFHGDIISPNAFDSTLSGDPSKVKMLWMHNSSRPVGVWNRIDKDEFGLITEGSLLLDVQDGRDARAHAKAGTVDGLSVGFIPKTERFDKTLNANVIEDVKLLEISLVTFPANDLARISHVKSMNEISSEEDLVRTKRAIESYLREVGLSKSFAQSIVANGVKAEGIASEDRDGQAKELTDLIGAISKTSQIINNNSKTI